MKKILGLALATIVLSSCSQLNDKAGKAFCACMETPTKMESDEKENPGTYTEEELNEAYNNMEECLGKVQDQYKDLVDEEGVKKSIKKHCPDTYKAMYPDE